MVSTQHRPSATSEEGSRTLVSDSELSQPVCGAGARGTTQYSPWMFPWGKRSQDLRGVWLG